MQFVTSRKNPLLIFFAVAALCAGSSWTQAEHRFSPGRSARGQVCASNDSSLALPAGLQNRYYIFRFSEYCRTQSSISPGFGRSRRTTTD